MKKRKPRARIEVVMNVPSDMPVHPDMIVITLIVAAVLTPPDPVTQVMLAGPAVLLWEIGYWISRAAWKEPESSDLDLADGGAAA